MRSKDIQQIEEYNRLIVSHLADLNFCNHKSNKIFTLKDLQRHAVFKKH